MGKSNLRKALCTVSAVSFAALGGCSFGSGAEKHLSGDYMLDGAITISRPVPAPEVASETRSMLAFLPVEKQRKGKWISINRAAGTIRLMKEDESLVSATGKGFDSLKPGSYEVVHKQRSAPWHASESYFQHRNLEVPAAGSKARFLRGALGEFVIFLDEQLPIHSGPIWSEEIGGVQIAEQDLSRIYYSVVAGATVEVQ